MWKCLLGERKSGKSVYIENYVKGINSETLYIATLPDLEMYRPAIIQHKKRRPPSWKCIELFNMDRKEILSFPYSNYRNIILDNLSYYILYQIYFHWEAFRAGCNEDVLSLIEKIATDVSATVYFIDTPINMDVLDSREQRFVLHFFNTIFEKADWIKKFVNKKNVCTLAVNEAKKYFFHTIAEKETVSYL